MAVIDFKSFQRRSVFFDQERRSGVTPLALQRICGSPLSIVTIAKSAPSSSPRPGADVGAIKLFKPGQIGLLGSLLAETVDDALEAPFEELTDVKVTALDDHLGATDDCFCLVDVQFDNLIHHEASREVWR
jgi:hypothetical protein